MTEFEIIKKDFLKELKSLNYSPNTIRAYRCDLDAIKEPTKKGILDSLVGLSGRSSNRRLLTGKKFFRFLKNHKLSNTINDCIPNAMDGLGSARVEKKLPRIPEIDLVAVETIRKSKHRLVIKLLVEAGLRASELSKLQNGDAYEDSDGCWIRVIQAKGKKDRLVPLHNRTYKLLCEFLAQGKHLPKSADIFYLTSKYFGCSPHDTRRYCCTQLVSNGMSPFSLMHMMGWSHISTAMSYVGLSDKLLVKEFEKCSV